MVAVYSLRLRVDLSHAECWQLYSWLGAEAPFVRSQLRTFRNGGTADVSLTTHEELLGVLEAIESGADGLEPLPPGLLALKLALAAWRDQDCAPEQGDSDARTVIA
jgi:hypothetical protein